MKHFVLISSMVLMTSMSYGKTCTYEFDVEKSTLQGTGYKTTEKVGVAGRFSGIKINKSEKLEEPQKLLEGLEVVVDLMTLDSGNALRDKNLMETLFAGVLGDSVATVTVKSVSDKKISTELKINEKTQTVNFDYSLKGDVFKATGKFDAMSFALGDQIAALKKRCGSLHTGSDGKSVTWTEFDLSVTAPLKKSCQ